MADEKTAKGKRGGPRPGSGRKPSEATKLRTAYLNTLHKDAVAASEAQRKLLDHLAKKIGRPGELEAADYINLLELLANVAEKIQNRAWGKPTQLTPEGEQPKGLILDL